MSARSSQARIPKGRRVALSLPTSLPDPPAALLAQCRLAARVVRMRTLSQFGQAGRACKRWSDQGSCGEARAARCDGGSKGGAWIDPEGRHRRPTPCWAPSGLPARPRPPPPDPPRSPPAARVGRVTRATNATDRPRPRLQPFARDVRPSPGPARGTHSFFWAGLGLGLGSGEADGFPGRELVPRQGGRGGEGAS